MRAFPDFVVSIRHAPRWVTARETLIVSQPALISLRRNSMTSPQRKPHHAEIRTNALYFG